MLPPPPLLGPTPYPLLELGEGWPDAPPPPLVTPLAAAAAAGAASEVGVAVWGDVAVLGEAALRQKEEAEEDAAPLAPPLLPLPLGSLEEPSAAAAPAAMVRLDTLGGR